MSIKKVKNISAKELKFWLRGILEFQDSDWVPSLAQWKLIKQKIELLNDVESQTVTREPPTPPPSRHLKEWEMPPQPRRNSILREEPLLVPRNEVREETLIMNPPTTNSQLPKTPRTSNVGSNFDVDKMIKPPYDPSKSDFR